MAKNSICSQAIIIEDRFTEKISHRRFSTCELCRFSNGKIYNCDLSASKNIGARYFIRVFLKSVPAKDLLRIQANVPELCRRTSCVLATLIHFVAELDTLKAGSPAA